MTTATVAARETFDLGRIFGRAFGVFGRSFWRLTGVALVGGALSLVLQMLIGVTIGLLTNSLFQNGKPPPLLVLIPSEMAILTLFFAPLGLITAAASSAVGADAEGRKAGFGELIGSGLRALPAVMGVYIVTGVAESAAYLFFVIPAIFLSLMWAVAVPALAAERLGVFKALGRSDQLTRDYRWAIFGLNIIVGLGVSVLLAVFFVAVGGVGALAGNGVSRDLGDAMILVFIGFGLLMFLGFIAIFMVAACITASLYAELRLVKEGGGSVAAVFA